MHEEMNCTVGVDTEQEPITIESLWKIYTEMRIVPMRFKPTGETVYVTPQVCDAIERHIASLCLHPELVEMPVTSLHQRVIACTACEKTVSIPRWNTGCLADLIGLEFGSKWQEEAARWCTCEKHRLSVMTEGKE